MKEPYSFGLFHQSLRQPFDYYQFGIDFIRPLINFETSHLLHTDRIDKIIQQLDRKENVILLANHQTEPDPQIISLLLEKRYASLASQMIFVAGHRVIEDPIAIPMSLGCNLLCIYSKKHMDHPPEEKLKKVSHNQRTMKKMNELLSEGGKCIYVAPSGGRDRPSANGLIEPAPFDPDSLEMFWLMAHKAKYPTHFYPLTLFTYPIMPPPNQVQKELGEQRKASRSPVFVSVGSEINMDHFPGGESLNKKEKRLKRAEYLFHLVYQDYHQIVNTYHVNIRTV